MQFSLYGSLWVQWCRKRLGCRILDLVDTQKFFISPSPPHSCLFLVLWFVFFRQLIALTFASNVSWKFEFVFVLDFQSLINRLCAKFHVAIFLHHVVCITFSNRAQHINYFILIKLCHFVGRLKHKYNNYYGGCLSLKIIRKPSIIF